MHCLAELPHLPQLQEKFGDEVATISWNLDHDDPDQRPPDVLQRSVIDKLEQLKITCQNVIAAEPMNDVLSHHDIFGLPATLVYGRDGQRVQLFEGAFTYEEDVMPLVRKLVTGDDQ